MIVGDGLLGKAFKAHGDVDNVLVFASGVSNSKTNDEEQFKREWLLLSRMLKQHVGKKLVYFSSCSIHGSKTNASLYVRHKLEIEAYIKKNVPDYLIVRLPNLVGRSDNPNQLTNFFFNKLISGELIHVDLTSVRYLIDVEDVPPIVDVLLTSTIDRKVFDVAFNNEVSIRTMMNIFEKICHREYNFQVISPFPKYIVDNSSFLDVILHNGDVNQYNHVAEDIIMKYYDRY